MELCQNDRIADFKGLPLAQSGLIHAPKFNNGGNRFNINTHEKIHVHIIMQK